MKPISFPEANVVYGEDQLEYLPLPAHRDLDDPQGRVTTCWELNPAELDQLLHTSRIWLQTLTFENKIQPQRLSVLKGKFK